MVRGKKQQISERFWNSEQSWNYERIVRVGVHRLRVAIRRNAYDFQSYCRGYMFDPQNLKWNIIVNAPIEGSACFDVSYVDRNPSLAPFRQDADGVEGELMAILP